MTIYLYVKTHTTTGLKYLGKTKEKDPHKYPGSGLRWANHLKVHGKTYTTQILLATESVEELKETGLFFSKLWNVEKSKDWANMRPETGDGGDGRNTVEHRDNTYLIGNKHGLNNSGNPNAKGLKGNKGPLKHIGKVWINDGNTNRRVFPEDIPTGWIRGKLQH